MLSKSMLDFRNLRTLLRRLCDNQKITVVSKWLNGEKRLSIYDELTEIIWASESKGTLLTNDLGTWDGRYDFWHTVTAQKEIAHAKGGERSIIVPELLGVHGG